jgi:hypothetical protein
VHRSQASALTAQKALSAAESLEEEGQDPDSVTVGILRLHAERMQLARRETRLQGRFTSAHPDVPVVEVAAQRGDVHDLDGLRAVGAELAGSAGD